MREEGMPLTAHIPTKEVLISPETLQSSSCNHEESINIIKLNENENNTDSSHSFGFNLCYLINDEACIVQKLLRNQAFQGNLHYSFEQLQSNVEQTKECDDHRVPVIMRSRQPSVSSPSRSSPVRNGLFRSTDRDTVRRRAHSEGLPYHIRIKLKPSSEAIE